MYYLRRTLFVGICLRVHNIMATVQTLRWKIDRANS